MAAYLPYLLPLLYLVLNEIVARNPNLKSSSLLGLVISTALGALKGAVGSNPPAPLP